MNTREINWRDYPRVEIQEEKVVDHLIPGVVETIRDIEGCDIVFADMQGLLLIRKLTPSSDKSQALWRAVAFKNVPFLRNNANALKRLQAAVEPLGVSATSLEIILSGAAVCALVPSR